MTLEQYILGAYLLGMFFSLGYCLATFVMLETLEQKPRSYWPAFVLSFLSWGFFIGMLILSMLQPPKEK